MRARRHPLVRAGDALARAAVATEGRPRFHFTPPSGWMNDPNGTVFHDGVYHLFYQHNPYRPRWGRIHWGHAISRDLLHWEHRPPALAPAGGMAERHCFSGCCAIAADGTPTILYTRISLASLISFARRGADQCAAFGDESLVAWRRYQHNPVLAGSTRVRHWRDPYVFRHDGHWWMVLAGLERHVAGGSVLLYRGEDLLHWELRGRLCRGDGTVRRGLECPNYFALDGRWVLLVSPYGPVRYRVGDFAGERHVGGQWATFDHGRAFYATNTFVDDARTVVVGWVRGPRGDGWAGCLSLPREVRVGAGAGLLIAPLGELASLRHGHRHVEAGLGPDKDECPALVLDAPTGELAAEFHLDSAAVCGFEIRSSRQLHRFSLDLCRNTVTSGTETSPMSLPGDRRVVGVRAFMDACVLEVFIDGREVFTSVLDDSGAGPVELVPFVTAGAATVHADLWSLDDGARTSVRSAR